MQKTQPNILLVFALGVFLILIFLLFSCRKDVGKLREKKYAIPGKILAGQKTGDGIRYHDFSPDVPIETKYPDYSVTIPLDLNNDGTNDLEFYRYSGGPHGSSGSGSDVKPLGNCQLAYIPKPASDTGQGVCKGSSYQYWTKLLQQNDSVNTSGSFVSKPLLLIQYYSWMASLPYCSYAGGPWGTTGPGANYIGLKIIKDNKTFFGWIRLQDLSHIAEYAITEEYEVL